MVSSFTTEEKEIINNIKKGCKRLIKKFSNRIESPKQYANLGKHTKVKPSMRTFIIFEVITRFQQNPAERFRRNDIVLRFPDNLKKCYYESELTRILQYFVDLNLIVHTPYQPNKKRPGRGTNHAVSGPKSYYKASQLLITTNTLLNNPEARNSIYKYLLDSELIHRLYETSYLISSNFKKQNNLEAVQITRNIIKLPRIKTVSELEEEFHEDYKKFNQLKKSQINQEAKIWAKMKLNNLTADDFFWLYPIGIVYYYADLLNQTLGFKCPVSIND
jgi:hypothetical protein